MEHVRLWNGMGMGKNDRNISYFGAYSKLGVLLIQLGGLVGFYVYVLLAFNPYLGSLKNMCYLCAILNFKAISSKDLEGLMATLYLR